MYNKAIQDKIAGMLGLNAEDFAKGWVSEEESEVTFTEGRFLTIDQENTLKDNHGKTRYDAGAEASREMLLKDMSKKVGFEESIKDSDKWIDAFRTDILKEAKVEPNKKLEDANESIEKLRGQITEKDSDYLLLQKKVTDNQVKFDVKSFIPTMPEGLGVSKDDAMSIYFMNHEVKEDGVYKNGALQKDNLEKSLSTEESVNSFITERKWNAVTPKGRGGGSGGSGSGTPTTWEDFEATCKENGFGQGSAEAKALLATIAKENPEILD
jgi:hypothetical protein